MSGSEREVLERFRAQHPSDSLFPATPYLPKNIQNFSQNSKNLTTEGSSSASPLGSSSSANPNSEVSDSKDEPPQPSQGFQETLSHRI